MPGKSDVDDIDDLVGFRVDWLVGEAVDDTLVEARKALVNFHQGHNGPRHILYVVENVFR